MFLIIIYDYAIGKPENIIDIFEINLVLISPEVLSFSKLNWMNLIETPQILEPSRGQATVFLTGAVILVGYISLFFTSRFKETSRELTGRGADSGMVQDVFVKQSVLTNGILFVSALLSALVYVTIPFLNGLLASTVSGRSYSYLVLGGLSVITLISTLFIFYSNHRSKDKPTKEPSGVELDASVLKS